MVKSATCLLVLTLISTNLFAYASADRTSTQAAEFFSFENDLEGWNVKATDIFVEDEPIDWSVTRSREQAEDGFTSLKFDVDNFTDAAKVWVERPFTVEPLQTYDVVVEFAFGSPDTGDIGLDRFIAGVLEESPTTAVDLLPSYMEPVSNTHGKSFGWLKKSYRFAVRSNQSGQLHVAIGFWGQFETGRIYYFDSIGVSLTKRAEGTIGPTIDSVVTEGRKKLMITGSGFSNLAGVFVNGVDQTERLRKASENVIELKGKMKKLIPDRLGIGYFVQVVGASGAVSNVYVKDETRTEK
jgi:hypothetical protein